MMRDEIDIMCCAGHKGLMGPTGTGFLVLKDDIKLDTIIEGGTGSNSANENQPEKISLPIIVPSGIRTSNLSISDIQS